MKPTCPLVMLAIEAELEENLALQASLRDQLSSLKSDYQGKCRDVDQTITNLRYIPFANDYHLQVQVAASAIE